jgi:hypothetical protein
MLQASALLAPLPYHPITSTEALPRAPWIARQPRNPRSLNSSKDLIDRLMTRGIVDIRRA